MTMLRPNSQTGWTCGSGGCDASVIYCCEHIKPVRGLYNMKVNLLVHTAWWSQFLSGHDYIYDMCKCIQLETMAAD